MATDDSPDSGHSARLRAIERLLEKERSGLITHRPYPTHAERVAKIRLKEQLEVQRKIEELREAESKTE